MLEQVLITECPRASSGLGEQSSTPHCHCSLAEGLSAELGRGPERGAGQRASARSWAEGLSMEHSWAKGLITEIMELFQILLRDPREQSDLEKLLGEGLCLPCGAS